MKSPLSHEYFVLIRQSECLAVQHKALRLPCMTGLDKVRQVISPILILFESWADQVFLYQNKLLIGEQIEERATAVSRMKSSLPWQTWSSNGKEKEHDQFFSAWGMFSGETAILHLLITADTG